MVLNRSMCALILLSTDLVIQKNFFIQWNMCDLCHFQVTVLRLTKRRSSQCTCILLAKFWITLPWQKLRMSVWKPYCVLSIKIWGLGDLQCNQALLNQHIQLSLHPFDAIISVCKINIGRVKWYAIIQIKGLYQWWNGKEHLQLKQLAGIWFLVP